MLSYLEALIVTKIKGVKCYCTTTVLAGLKTINLARGQIVINRFIDEIIS